MGLTFCRKQSDGALQSAQVMHMILILKPWRVLRITHPGMNYIVMTAQKSQGLRGARGGRAGQGGAPARADGCPAVKTLIGAPTFPSMRRCFCRHRYPKAWEERAADARAKEARLRELMAIQL